MPWKMMTAHEPPTANRSILLDFVSPLNIVTLFTSTRIPGCVIIAVATGGGLILKLIIVLSTGLFVLQYTPMERERDLTLITDFGVANGTAFEPSSIDWRPVSRVYAIANYSLPHPSGTYSQYDFQKFDDPRGTSILPLWKIRKRLIFCSTRDYRQHDCQCPGVRCQCRLRGPYP